MPAPTRRVSLRSLLATPAAQNQRVSDFAPAPAHEIHEKHETFRRKHRQFFGFCRPFASFRVFSGLKILPKPIDSSVTRFVTIRACRAVACEGWVIRVSKSSVALKIF